MARPSIQSVFFHQQNSLTYQSPSGFMTKASHRQHHAVATVEEISQSFFQTRVVEVFTEQPIADAVPEASVGVVVGVLAELDDVGPAQHLCLELGPVDLRSLGVHLN